MTELLVEVRAPATAEQFIRDRLADGNTLANAALEHLPLAQGCVTTLLPRGVVPQSLEEYGTGGKLPTPPVSEWKGTQHGDETLLMIPVPTTDAWLVTKVKNHLQRAEDHVCVIEDALKRPTDAVLRSSLTRFATYDDEVYHLLFHEDAQEDRILATLRAAKSVPIFIGALTRCPQELLRSRPKNLSLDQIQSLAIATQELFVGAYDGEGYLIWTK